MISIVSSACLLKFMAALTFHNFESRPHIPHSSHITFIQHRGGARQEGAVRWRQLPACRQARLGPVGLSEHTTGQHSTAQPVHHMASCVLGDLAAHRRSCMSCLGNFLFPLHFPRCLIVGFSSSLKSDFKPKNTEHGIRKRKRNIHTRFISHLPPYLKPFPFSRLSLFGTPSILTFFLTEYIHGNRGGAILRGIRNRLNSVAVDVR